MRPRVSTALFGLLIACRSDSTGPSQTSNGALVVISTGASSLHQQETTLAESPSGRIVAVWIGFLDQTTTFAAQIEYAISDDSGRTWGHPAAVALPSGYGIMNDPALAVDSLGNFTLAALTFELPGQPPHIGIYVYSLPVGAKAFGSPVAVDTLAAPPSYFDKPQIAVTTGGLLVTYNLVGPGSGPNGLLSRAGIASTSGDGITWQHDTIAMNAPTSIALCPSGQSVTATYISEAGGLWAATSANGGATWSSPIEIDPAGTNANFPACARRGEDEWVTYGIGVSSAGLVHSGDGGAHFASIPVGIVGSVADAQLTVRADGYLDIAYYNSNPSLHFGFVHALLAPGASTLGTPEVIKGGMQFSSGRQVQNGLVDFVGVIPGAIVFTDNSTGTSHIAFYRETQ